MDLRGNVMEKTIKKLIRSQKALLSNASIYRQLAKETDNKKMRKALKKMAGDDKKNAKTLKKISGTKQKPNALIMRLKKELYKCLGPRDLYNLTVLKRRINEKRYQAMLDQQVSEAKADPKLKEKLAVTVVKSRAHMDRMKQLL